MGLASRVAIVTLGCARNEVDSEELGGRLSAAGWDVVGDDCDADVVLVNTCGFITAAKKESIDTILAEASQHDGRRKVVAVGCLAERYGAELAEALPDADAVLGFDSYGRIEEVLGLVASGVRVESHSPRDRRLLPVVSVDAEQDATSLGVVRGIPGGRLVRRRQSTAPVAPLKIATGCDRRCSFCAIPAFRGRFRSRPVDQVVSEGRWLVRSGVRELILVSENATSYGKDLAGVGLDDLLVALDRELSEVESESARLRLSYLQPAEVRPSLIRTVASLDRVVPYFDMSFQHADATVLRRMRRFGSGDDFLRLIDEIRGALPGAGIRSNFIVGFPGETARAFDTLLEFVADARLDAVGVFAYSKEDGTLASSFEEQVREEDVRARVDAIAALADTVAGERAEKRIGTDVEVLIESVDDSGHWAGRAGHQGPEDGETRVVMGASGQSGQLVSAKVVSNVGVDLIAEVC